MVNKRYGILSILIAIMLACNLPGRNLPISSLIEPTTASIAIPTIGLIADTPSLATIAPVPLSTDTASPTPTPQNPLVIRATLCSEGPGSKYEVVSALNLNERVKLLGRGSVTGWLIVENPTYHDPCWVAETALQIDPGIDLTNLKIFNPPPPSTPTKPPPTPTP